jgi:ribosomal RNA-processing protein 12
MHSYINCAEQKAGGDVKKGGVEPYAYLSLGDAAKKKGRSTKIGIAGKR